LLGRQAYFPGATGWRCCAAARTLTRLKSP
jgi:hypothetical protein